MSLRIIIADDHQLVLEGLVSMINNTTSFELIGTASNGRDVLNMIKDPSIQPDIILMDIDMPLLNGIEAARAIKKQYPKIRILILTMHEESIYYNKLIAAQVDGFIMKSSSQQELLFALQEVANGKSYFSENYKAKKIELQVNGEGHDQLSEREVEILKKIALGMSNSEISEELGISVRTVDTHRTNLKKKLAVTSIAGLVRYAIQQGYLS